MNADIQVAYPRLSALPARPSGVAGTQLRRR
jgi:hypothetical protein